MRIKQGKRPWIFCFNPECKTRKEYEKNKKNNNKNKEEKEKEDSEKGKE